MPNPCSLDPDYSNSELHRVTADRFEEAARTYAEYETADRCLEAEVVNLYYSCFHRLHQYLHLAGGREGWRKRWDRIDPHSRRPIDRNIDDPLDFTIKHNLIVRRLKEDFELKEFTGSWSRLNARTQDCRYNHYLMDEREFEQLFDIFEDIHRRLKALIAPLREAEVQRRAGGLTS